MWVLTPVILIRPPTRYSSAEVVPGHRPRVGRDVAALHGVLDERRDVQLGRDRAPRREASGAARRSASSSRTASTPRSAASAGESPSTSSPSAAATSRELLLAGRAKEVEAGGHEDRVGDAVRNAVVRGDRRRGGVHDRVRVHVERDARHACSRARPVRRRRDPARTRALRRFAPIMRIARMLIESSSGSRAEVQVRLDRVRERVGARRRDDVRRGAEHQLRIDDRDSRGQVARGAHDLEVLGRVGDHDDERHLGAGAAGRRQADDGRPGRGTRSLPR